MLHRCQNFHFSTSQKWLLLVFFSSEVLVFFWFFFFALFQAFFYLLLYHFELFGMACDPWPLCHVNVTCDIDNFCLSVCINFGSHFWFFFVLQMSGLANINLTHDNTPISTRDCWTIWNGTVLPKWFRHLPRLTITYVTYQRFQRVHYMLLLNWPKWYSILNTLSGTQKKMQLGF